MKGATQETGRNTMDHKELETMEGFFRCGPMNTVCRAVRQRLRLGGKHLASGVGALVKTRTMGHCLTNQPQRGCPSRRKRRQVQPSPPHRTKLARASRKMRERAEVPQDRHRPLIHRLELVVEFSKLVPRRWCRLWSVSRRSIERQQQRPMARTMRPVDLVCIYLWFLLPRGRVDVYPMSSSHGFAKKQECLLLFMSFIVLFRFAPVHLVASRLWTTTTVCRSYLRIKRRIQYIIYNPSS